MGQARQAIALCLLLVPAAAVIADDALPPEMVQRLKDATVYVKTKIGPLQMTGSGFVIQTTRDTALVVTNQHVIVKPKELQEGSYIPGLRGRDRLALRHLQSALSTAEPEVSLVFNSGNGNEQTIKADVLGGLEEPDLAIVRVSGVKAPPGPIEFRRIAQPVETMSLYILGFPFGDALATNNGNPTITIGKGSVSSIRKDAGGKLARVQIDGALNPGNSGGPVVDVKGNLVGIAVQTIQGSNIGMAIPPGELSAILEGSAGNPSVVVGPTVNGAPAKYEIVVPVIDPMKKLRSVSIRYVDHAVPIEVARSGQPQLESASDSRPLTVTLTDREARAALPSLATGQAPPKEVTVQVSFVGGQGQRHLNPLVLKVPAPAVVAANIKQDGGSATFTQTQKSGKRTIRREVTITQGKPAGKSAFEDTDDNPSADDDSASDDAGSGSKRKKASDDDEDDDAKSDKGSSVAWTNKIAKMKKIPDEEVSGSVDGIDFTLDQAALTGGRLVFKKGPRFRGVFSEAELDIVLFLKPHQDVSGQKILVNGRSRGGPHIVTKAMRKGDKLPKTQSFTECLLVLEFGDYDAKARKQPGKVYICLPDRGKSFLAGTFEASVD
jgi:S1-C subfamily serine protease